MILRSILVRGWRCFADEVQVGPLGERINVVYGPNGTGKSTLFQAMARAFLDAHRVGGDEAEGMRPWGRMLTPTVTVAFACGGREYRVTKRFLDRPSSELSQREGDRFRRIAEDDASDEQVRQFLNGNAPGKGLSDSRHWGLSQVLWTLQGDLSLGELTGDLANDIRAMLGAQVAGPLGSRLEQKLEVVYRQYFTPSGKVKSGQNAPEVVRLEAAKTKADERLKGARQKVDMFESMSRRLEDLRAIQGQSRQEAAALSAAVADADKRAGAYTALIAERRHRSERVKSTEAEAQALKQRLDDIRSCNRELTEAGENREALAAEVPLRAKAAQEASNAALGAKAELENARAKRVDVDAACATAEDARIYADTQANLAAGQERLNGVRQADADLAELRSERARVLAPDVAALREIRKADADLREADIRLDAALISVEIVPERDCSVSVLAGEATGLRRSFPGGSAAAFKGSPEVVLDLEGFGRLRASGPAGSVEKYRQQKEDALSRLKTLTQPFGTSELDALEALHRRAEQLDAQIQTICTRLETLLLADAPDTLEQRLAGLRATLSGIEEEYASWHDAPPALDVLQERAERATASFRASVAVAEDAWETAQSTRTAAETKHGEVGGRLREVEKQIQTIAERLRKLTADDKSVTEREAELRVALLAWEAAKAERDETERQLSAYPADPGDELKRLQRQRDAAEGAASRALGEEKLEEGRLANLTLEAPHSLLAAAEEEVAALSERLDRETLRMKAVGLLWNTYSSSKAQAVAAVTAPVESAATRTLERIAGRRFGGIHLGGGFVPDGLRPEMAKSTVAIAEASCGEREQIFLATRLALAEVLASNERQLVILDDALTASDTGRLTRAMRVLEEAADKLQILILTCHPERYRGIQEANFIDLEALMSGAVVS